MAKKVISTGGYPVDMSSGDGITPEDMASMTMNLSQIKGFGEAGREIAEADTSDEVKAMLGVKDGGPGPANKLTVGSVTKLPAGSQPKVDITGDSPNQVVNFSLVDGASVTLKVGSVSMLSVGSNATARLSGVYPDYVIDFGFPAPAKGDSAPTNKLSVGTVTQLAVGAQPTVTITGDAPNQTINFGFPASKDGVSPTLKVGTVTTLSSGSAATAEITGTAPNFTVNFGIPQGSTPSAATAIQTETVSGVVATAGAKVAVKFTKTYTAPPNVTPYNAIVNGQLVIGVPSDVTATGCNVIVVQTRGTLLLTTGPIENSPAGTAFRIKVIGY
ncbi:hypothetical protein LMA04_00635 [Pseudescherichia vulneris]|uniref:hypothetical protein n=1 Tax=Pseudescherichia vulneris TaxID=566 RepID=UPI00227CEFB7|nr:hypothetical protein [Pseudescherichia vulneris]WAH52601.1 hypothetical protein LMA04_00635 [Pseudescherichia vulneris]